MLSNECDVGGQLTEAGREETKPNKWGIITLKNNGEKALFI